MLVLTCNKDEDCESNEERSVDGASSGYCDGALANAPKESGSEQGEEDPEVCCEDFVFGNRNEGYVYKHGNYHAIAPAYHTSDNRPTRAATHLSLFDDLGKTADSGSNREE